MKAMRGSGWWKRPDAASGPAWTPAKRGGAHLGRVLRTFRFQGRGFQVVADSLALLRNGVIAFQERHGRNWRDPFVDFYLGERMQVALDEACGVPTFSADVARADDATCAIYQAELELLVDKLAAGFCGAQARALSLLSGAAAMARAVKDDRLRQEILAAANAAAKAI
jgi:TetR/AcrR family transcriptional regulator, transcriptional repressor for nem operon